MKQSHKLILFDEILAPTKEKKAIIKLKKINQIRYIFLGLLKWVGIVFISIIGSLLLSAFLTSILQERTFSSVIHSFTEKFLNLF